MAPGYFAVPYHPPISGTSPRTVPWPPVSAKERQDGKDDCHDDPREHAQENHANGSDEAHRERWGADLGVSPEDTQVHERQGRSDDDSARAV